MSQVVDAVLERIRGNNAPKGLIHTVGRNVEVTTLELAEVVRKNPTHDIAKESFQKTITEFVAAPHQKHVVNAVDLQAVIENRKVIVVTTVENGITKQRKILEEKAEPSFPSSDE